MNESKPHQITDPFDTIKHILKVSERLNELKDLDAILDRILEESRLLSNADAGTLFLVKDGDLVFEYIQNESFADQRDGIKIYSNQTIPINGLSIVGYVAQEGKPLCIDDAYALPEGLSCTFNSGFDTRSGYHTKSILTVPIKSSQRKVIGVIQIINAKNDLGEVIPFTKAMEHYLGLFANNASVAIEQGIITREVVLRMVKMAELRDPTETGAHVQRVGAYSAEIYDNWAQTHGIEKAERKRIKDRIRIAAMLHDVGKVGVSDTILKKPGRLSETEFDQIKLHTVHGRNLFTQSTSDLDEMSAEIASNHHEKWDGSGYPGHMKGENEDVKLGSGKQGSEIPLAARICAVADVYDALCSKRSYKEAWDENQAVDEIKKASGIEFDPEVVASFLNIQPTINSIREHFNGT
ncbi:MAG: HD domain-containing protein [Candidatus Marinimicrobia bacterium]|nr:HD domain-containing protein [Candidatus Neomarinimicrobiota bacterium]